MQIKRKTHGQKCGKKRKTKQLCKKVLINDYKTKWSSLWLLNDFDYYYYYYFSWANRRGICLNFKSFFAKKGKACLLPVCLAAHTDIRHMGGMLKCLLDTCGWRRVESKGYFLCTFPMDQMEKTPLKNNSDKREEEEQNTNIGINTYAIATKR